MCHTGLVYYSEDTLCTTCTKAYYTGKRYLAEHSDDPVSLIYMNVGPRFMTYEGSSYKAPPLSKKEMLEALRKLVSVSNLVDEYEGFIFYEYQDDYVPVTVKVEDLELLKDFLRTINYINSEAYQKGKEYGANLLKRLNDGDISNDEFLHRKRF